MTKEKLIAAILEDAKIHHNISTLGMKLPDVPEDCKDDLFSRACEDWITLFIEDWEQKPINDCGNRNLCDCRHSNPRKVREDGACTIHDLYHCYTYGRMGATLYWDKYWHETGHTFAFKLDEDDLAEKELDELAVIGAEIDSFNAEIKRQKAGFPLMLKELIEEWKREDRAEKRREALGYNKTLSELLEHNDPQVVRLAKGIKKELNK